MALAYLTTIWVRNLSILEDDNFLLLLLLEVYRAFNLLICIQISEKDIQNVSSLFLWSLQDSTKQHDIWTGGIFCI